jgi:hypothetical protein
LRIENLPRRCENLNALVELNVAPTSVGTLLTPFHFVCPDWAPVGSLLVSTKNHKAGKKVSIFGGGMHRQDFGGSRNLRSIIINRLKDDRRASDRRLLSPQIRGMADASEITLLSSN